MWEKLFHRFASGLLTTGTLELTMPDGTRRLYGDGSGPPVRVHITDPEVIRQIVLSPEMGLGEAYMDGTLLVENDDLHAFMTLAIRNVARNRKAWFVELPDAIRNRLLTLHQLNGKARSRRNVAHHYDLSAQLYDLFLDEDRQYSCAYFTDPAMTLEAAQAAKKAHIAGKLLLKPGMTVLDIGCGWGGLGLTLARDYGARVVGVTLSEEQHKIAVARARAAGLADRVEFRLTDYRHVTERFDRVVSVGMFEHVGRPHYREYFRNVHERLAPDGVALIHTIGRSSPPGATSAWIDKYIFPGGYVPALSETMAAIEKQDLYTTDVEIWRLHYAMTLRHWHDRFMAHWDKARDLYDERFCRMWRYYLVASELTFRHHHQCVFQIQLAHRQEAVPLTRDYLYPGDHGEPLRHAAE